jgi:hypothetical protein
MRLPSIGATELLILAGIAGLVMLILALLVAAVMRRPRTNAPRAWTWIVVLGSILIGLPLVLFILGISLVTPVSVKRSTAPTSQAAVVTVGPNAAPRLTATASGDGPPSAPTPGISPPNPVPVSDTASPSWSIVPDTWLEAVAIPTTVAALIVFIGAALVAFVLSRWPGPTVDTGNRTRYVLLALVLWIALSLFLVLDLGLGLAVSIYPRFVAAYAAFWALVGALMLYRRPVREQVLILALFAALLFSMRFIDWNSRKPFLRDLSSINEGMTPAQVEQIMAPYMTGGGRPLGSPTIQVDARGEILTGTLTYRHTDEGWGDSDWGVVAFVDGRVVRTHFLPH